MLGTRMGSERDVEGMRLALAWPAKARAQTQAAAHAAARRGKRRIEVLCLGRFEGPFACRSLAHLPLASPFERRRGRSNAQPNRARRRYRATTASGGKRTRDNHRVRIATPRDNRLA